MKFADENNDDWGFEDEDGNGKSSPRLSRNGGPDSNETTGESWDEAILRNIDEPEYEPDTPTTYPSEGEIVNVEDSPDWYFDDIPDDDGETDRLTIVREKLLDDDEPYPDPSDMPDDDPPTNSSDEPYDFPYDNDDYDPVVKDCKVREDDNEENIEWGPSEFEDCEERDDDPNEYGDGAGKTGLHYDYEEVDPDTLEPVEDLIACDDPEPYEPPDYDYDEWDED